MVQFYSLTCICPIFLTFTTCKRDSLLPTAHSFPLCHRLIDHMCKGLFLGSLFYSIYLHVFIFVPVAHCLDYYSFAVYFKIKEEKIHIFVFFLKIVLAIQSSVYPYIFKILFQFYEKCYAYVDIYSIKSVHCFEQYDHFSSNSSDPLAVCTFPFISLFLNLFQQYLIAPMHLKS